MKRTALSMAVVAVFAHATFATTFDITAERVGAGPIGPGDTVNYQIVVELSEDNSNLTTGNEGLALIGFDLGFDGNDLAQCDTPVDPPMSNFVKDLGLTNPAGYGGTVDSSGTFDILLQVGGAQNTIKNFADANNAPYPIGPVTTGIAWPGSPQVVATGSLTAPAVEGPYTLSISNAFANVIKAGEDGTVFWATKEALVDTVTDLDIVVSAACIPASYASSVPASTSVGDTAIQPQGTLDRTEKNVIRLTLDNPAPSGAPNAGDVEIRELLDGGAYGADLSASFTFSMEAGDTVLRIADTGSTIDNQKWYAIINANWDCVDAFERHYASAYGDASGEGLVQFADLAQINAGIGAPFDDQDRNDINGDGSVQFADIASANASIGSDAIAKPSGH